MAYQADVISDSSTASGFSARFEVHSGDQPYGPWGESSQVSAKLDGTDSGGIEGSTWWYSFSTKFDAGFRATTLGYAISNVWNPVASGDASIAFEVGNTNATADTFALIIRKYSAPGTLLSTVVAWETPLNRDSWHDIALEVKWSATDAIGYVKLWQGGVAQTLFNGSTTYQTRTLVPTTTRSVYREGLWRDPMATTDVIYHSGFEARIIDAGSIIPPTGGDGTTGGTLLFSANYETGNTLQYPYSETSGGTTQPVVATGMGGSGTYVGKYVANGAQYRCENVSAYTGPVSGHTGEVKYYGWKVYIPSTIQTVAWQLVGQWHQIWEGGSGPGDAYLSAPLCYRVADTQSGFGANHWAIGQAGWEVPPGSGTANAWYADLGLIQYDQWTSFVTRLAFSDVASSCDIKVWKNRVKVADLVPITPLVYPATDPNNRCSFMKVGIYHEQVSVNNTVYFDNVKVGTSWGIVDPDV